MDSARQHADGPPPPARGSVPSAPPADTRARKAELRRSLRAARRERYGGEAGQRLRAQEAGDLVEHAAPLLARLSARAEAAPTSPTVAVFHPMPTEPDVLPLLRMLCDRLPGARLLFPGTGPDAELDWIAGSPDARFAASGGAGFGSEPDGPHLGSGGIAEADLILAPALAVDRSATRLGHGGGYYDRALPRRRSGVPVVAIVHPTEVLAAGDLQRLPHDVPVDAVLTSAGLLALPVTSPPARGGGPS